MDPQKAKRLEDLLLGLARDLKHPECVAEPTNTGWGAYLCGADALYADAMEALEIVQSLYTKVER